MMVFECYIFVILKHINNRIPFLAQIHRMRIYCQFITLNRYDDIIIQFNC